MRLRGKGQPDQRSECCWKARSCERRKIARADRQKYTEPVKSHKISTSLVVAIFSSSERTGFISGLSLLLKADNLSSPGKSCSDLQFSPALAALGQTPTWKCFGERHWFVQPVFLVTSLFLFLVQNNLSASFMITASFSLPNSILTALVILRIQLPCTFCQPMVALLFAVSDWKYDILDRQMIQKKEDYVRIF